MKRLLFILTISFLYVSSVNTKLFAQTYTTVSKRCGKCAKSVSSSSKIGDTCPHCGVRWGYENTSTSTSTSYKYYTLSDNNTSNSNSNSKTAKTQNTYKAPIEKNPFATYSKQQTENWIIDKLSSYGKSYTRTGELLGMYSSTSYSDFEYKFQDDYFIVSYLFNNTDDKITYIPLYDVNYLYAKDYSDNFSIATNSETMYEVNLTSNSKNTSSYVSIGFQTNAETDIIKKLEKAFLRLKILSKKSTSTQLPTFTPKKLINKPSVAETKVWLLQKLNSYKSNIFHPGPNVETPYGNRNLSSSDHNFSFEFFNDEWLTIKYYVGEGQYEQLRTVQIPICEVTISKKRYEYNGSTANLQFYSSYKKIMTGSGDANEFSVQIDFSREENLESRILKAFANLKSYCQTTKQKETF